MKPEKKQLWSERLAALKHLPAVGRLVWHSSRALVVGGLVARTIAALIPLALLGVSRLILDFVVNARSHPGSDLSGIWPLLIAEFGIGAAALSLGPLIDYFDARLADQFTHKVSLQVMDHAASLDLASFEDSSFYD